MIGLRRCSRALNLALPTRTARMAVRVAMHAVLPVAHLRYGAGRRDVSCPLRLLEQVSIYGWLLPSVRRSTQWLPFQRS